MDKKKLMLLLGALVIAIGTALAARSMFMGASAPEAEAAAEVPKGPKVLVAQRALPIGTIITADSINFQLWPEELVQDAYFIDGEADMSKLLGTVVRYPVTAGEPVTQGALVAPGDRGFLAAALGPGMRAITIPVSAKTGVGGFIFPGDRVDLMLTQTVNGAEGDALKVAETVLRNLRILATDQSTETEIVDGKTVVRAFRTVTLEVTPRIAEKISVAGTIGTLSLSLRSIADNQAELERAIANGDVTVPEGATKAEEEALLSQAIRSPIEGKSTFVTGGDVSRFQRRSVPKKAEETAQNMMNAAMNAAQAVPAAAPAAVRTGPVVRVTRGKSTTDVPVSAN
ncbi:MAG: Flp pilus assembly protein CpaB [Novosphingobium sp.]|nr:Flp pilus assembly protein CpaB [Novosphingobium sp.]